MALRYSPVDEVLDLSGVDAAPWFGYCAVPQQQRALLLPDTLQSAHLQCLKSDPRQFRETMASLLHIFY